MEGLVWEVTRPLEGDCEVEFFTWDDKLGVETFWHSAAHVLGSSLEKEFGGHLCFGPPLEAGGESGFFYDSYVGTEVFSNDTYPKIEAHAAAITKQKMTFQRIVVDKKVALEIFKHNPFKIQLITTKIRDDG